ncbi:MAG TPA: hypothetical protein PKJ51_11385, partial [Methanothrix sp.]|nr:hypothetical protein [Methanothrix sp.]
TKQPISITVRDADGTIRCPRGRGRVEWLDIRIESFLGEALRAEVQALGDGSSRKEAERCEERIGYWSRKEGEKNVSYWRGRLAVLLAKMEAERVVIDLTVTPHPQIKVRINGVPVEWDGPTEPTIQERWATD